MTAPGRHRFTGPAAVAVIEPVYRDDGRPGGWRAAPPRPRDAHLRRLLSDGELRLDPDGTATARPVGVEPLTGTWRRVSPHGPILLALATAPQDELVIGRPPERDPVRTLDGYLTPDPSGGCRLDAILTVPGAPIGTVLAHVTHRLAVAGPEYEPPEPPPPIPPEAIPSPESLLPPEILELVENAPPEFSAPDRSAFGVGQGAGTGEGAGAGQSEGAGTGQGEGAGTGEGAGAGTGQSVGMGTCQGEDTGTGMGTGAGPPRTVAELRARLPDDSLTGRWRGVFGPARGRTLTLRTGAQFATPGPPADGFLRLARRLHVAVGLTAAGTGWEPVVFAADPPDLSRLDAADAVELRRLANDLIIDGRYGVAAPLLDRVAELYAMGGAPRGASGWIDLLHLRNDQAFCAFVQHAFHRLPDILVAAADARRALVIGPDAMSPWRDALAFLASTAGDLHQNLRLLADLADATPGCPAHLRAAAGSAAATVAAVCDEIRAADADAGDPDAIEAAAARLDQVIAEAQRALRATAEAFEAAEAASPTWTPAPGETADADPPQEVVRLMVRGGVDVFDVLRSRLERSDPAGSARRLRSETGEAATAVGGFVEVWRALLDDHWDKILTTDLALPYYTRMIRLLLEIDAAEDALVASEMSRARAFADALRADRAGRAADGPGQAPPVTREMLRDVLARHDAVVVEYFLLDDALLVWVCPPGGEITVINRPLDRAELRETVAEFNRLARTDRHDSASRATLAAVLRRLGALVWDVIPAELLPGDPDAPVTVVPHLELFQVPFPALRDAAGTYLVQRHAVRLLPALSLTPDLVAPAVHRADEPPSLVALVNPSPLAEGAPLDWTELHFDEITELYGERHAVHTGADADLATLRRVAADGTVLYFGTHARAVVEPGADPLMSYLVLAPSPGHDGLLRAKDVPDLGIGADLVILAACETGHGTATADGVIGLSRAFLASGPSGLIMTLYPVGQRASLDLMAAFHEYWLLDGLDPVSALRRAQCQAVAEQSATEQEPHLWAAFTFYGLPRTPARTTPHTTTTGRTAA